MEHPLRMDADAMRRAGYATVDALVARLADPAADPVLRRTSPGQMRSRPTGDDFRWLLDTEPTARAAIARDLADRLPER